MSPEQLVQLKELSDLFNSGNVEIENIQQLSKLVNILQEKLNIAIEQFQEESFS